jgi:SH3-like domain-containing protein
MTSGFLGAMAAALFVNGQATDAIGRRPADSRLGVLCLCVGLLLAASTAIASERLGSDTGYPLPRFVSIDKSEANLRSGPGAQYPILTVLQWRNMPVKIIDEYRRWRKVELHDGSTGWLHKVLLSGRRTFLIRQDAVTLHEEPRADSPAVAIFATGAIAYLQRCDRDWCRITASGYNGWVTRSAGWGVLRDEIFK